MLKPLSRKRKFALVAAAVGAATGMQVKDARAANFVWTGGGNVNWSNAANWSGGVPASSTATVISLAGVVNTGTSGTPLLQNAANPLLFGTMVFASGAGEFYIGNGSPFEIDTNASIIQNSNSNQSIVNNITKNSSFNNTANLTLDGDGDGVVTLSGNILRSNGNRNIALVKQGTSTFVLSGSGSNYTGTTSVLGGTLIVGSNAPSGSNGALGNASSAVLVGDTSGDDDASLLTGGAVTIGRAVTVQAGSSGTVTLGGNAASTSIFSGTITLNKEVVLSQVSGGTVSFNGAITDGAGSFGVTKEGNGTVVLGSTTNNYDGATTINAGTLRLGVSNVIPDGAGRGNVIIQSGGTFDINSKAETINGLFGEGTVDNQLAGTGTLIIGNNNTSSTFTGSLANSLGTLTLTKTGTGSITLAGEGTKTGITTINGGTLVVGTASSLGTSAAPITINGGTLNIASDESINAHNVTLTGASTIVANKATASSGGITHTLGTLNIGGQTLTISKGANVSDDAAGVQFGMVTIASSTFNTAADVTTTFGNASGSGNGTTTLSGAGNYSTGSINYTGVGTLTINGSGALSITGFSSVGAATINLGGSADATIGTVSSSAAVTINGSGTGDSTITGSITSGAATAVNVTAAGSLALTGTSTSPGTLTANSNGTLILRTGSMGGNKTFNIGTTSSVGKLSIQSDYTIGTSGNPTVNIAGGIGGTGTLDMVSGGINTLTINSGSAGANVLTLSDGTANRKAVLNFELGATADKINLGPGLKATIGAGGALVNITGIDTFDGTQQVLINAPGGLTGGANATLNSTTGNFGGYTVSLASNATQLLLNQSLNPTPSAAYWKGSLDGSWGTFSGGNANDTNWRTSAAGGTDTNQVPGATTDVFFVIDASPNGPATNLNTTLDQDYAIKSLTFRDPATGTVTIGGSNKLTIGAGGLTVTGSSGAHNITADVSLAGSQAWAINNSAANGLTIGGVLSGGASALTKSGNGTLVLTGAASNVYSGQTTITGGTLNLDKSGTANAMQGNLQINGGTVAYTGNSTNMLVNGADVTVNGGTLALGANHSDTINTLTLVSGSVTGSGTSTITAANAYNVQSGSVSAILAGTNGLNKSTGGTVTLSGVNTYSNTTTISGGTLLLTSTGSINNSNTIDVQSGATFNVAAHGGYQLSSGKTLKGSGTVSGAIVANSGSTVTPGSSSIATLTSNGSNWTLTGSTAMDISRAGVGNYTNDVITGINFLTYGGTLSVSRLGGDAVSSYAAGDTWDLFNFTSQTGTFANNSEFGTSGGTTLPSLSGGLKWQFNYGTGVLSVAPSTTSATFNLSANLTGANTIIVGGTTTLTSTITNSGAGTADKLNFNGLSASADIGSIGGSSLSGTNLNNADTPPNSSTTGTLTYTGTSAGTATITPTTSGTPTNASLGGNATAGSTTTATVTVLDHAAGSLASGTLAMPSVIVGYGASQTATVGVSNAAGLRVDLKTANDGAHDNLSLSNASGVAAGGSTNLTGTLATGQGIGNYSQVFVVTHGDDSSLSGNNPNVSTQNLTFTGTVYDHSNASLAAGSTDTSETLTFNTLKGASVAGQSFTVYNRDVVVGLTTDLKLTGFGSSGDAAISTNLATFNGLAAGNGNTYTANVDTSSAGSYSKTITMSGGQLVDDSSMAGAGGNNNGTLTVNIVANVGMSYASSSNNRDLFGGSLTGTVAGSGSYSGLESQVAGTTGTGDGASALGTIATIVAGKNATGSAEEISMAWRTRTRSPMPSEIEPPTKPLLALKGELGSDILRLTGMDAPGGNHSLAGRHETDAFALQMTYDGSEAFEEFSAIQGNIFLVWLNPGEDGVIGDGVNAASADDRWVNAVEGNFGVGSSVMLNPQAFTNVHSSWEDFAAMNSITNDNLSDFVGAWGVDTSSTYGGHQGVVWAVLNHNSDFAVVPEPSTAAVIGLAAGAGLLGRGRRRRKIDRA